MNIREYKPEDHIQVENLLAELQDLEAKIIPGMKPGKEMAERYLRDAVLEDVSEKEGKIFVAEQDRKVIGFLWVYVEKEPRDFMYTEPIYVFLHIGDFIVTRNFRGQGIGKALMRAVENYAKEKGIDKIKLQATAKNIQAREVYEKWDFEEDEVTLIKYLK